MSQRLFLYFALCTLHFTFAPDLSAAAPPIVLTDDQAEYNVLEHIEILPSEGNDWTIDDITSPLCPTPSASFPIRHPQAHL